MFIEVRGCPLVSLLLTFIVCLGPCPDHSNMCLGIPCWSGCRSAEVLYPTQVGDVSDVFCCFLGHLLGLLCWQCCVFPWSLRTGGIGSLPGVCVLVRTEITWDLCA